MSERESRFYRTGRAWCIQHPVTDGVACGVAFFIVSSLLIGFAFPAWALSIPITEHIVINLGDLPPWIGAIVAVIVYLEARSAKKKAAEAVIQAALGRTELKAVSVQIDGLLAARDKENIKEGKREEKIAGEEKAATLAEGQRQGRESQNSTGNPLAAAQDAPVPVVDDVAGSAAVKSATALESLANSAKKTEEKQ